MVVGVERPVGGALVVEVRDVPDVPDVPAVVDVVAAVVVDVVVEVTAPAVATGSSTDHASASDASRRPDRVSTVAPA